MTSTRSSLLNSNLISLLLSNWATCNNREKVWKDAKSTVLAAFSLALLLSDRRFPNISQPCGLQSHLKISWGPGSFAPARSANVKGIRGRRAEIDVIIWMKNFFRRVVSVCKYNTKIRIFPIFLTFDLSFGRSLIKWREKLERQTIMYLNCKEKIPATC